MNRDSHITDDAETPAVSNRRAQCIGSVVWPSFLGACLASLLFFGSFDPQPLASQLLGEDAGRLAGYTLGFFFFWLISASASALTAYLLVTRPPPH